MIYDLLAQHMEYIFGYKIARFFIAHTATLIARKSHGSLDIRYDYNGTLIAIY